MRLNAQSWESEGLKFDLEFATIYKAFLGIIRSPRQPATQIFIFDATCNVAIARRRISVALGGGYSRVTIEIWDTQERARFCMAQLRGIKFA